MWHLQAGAPTPGPHELMPSRQPAGATILAWGSCSSAA
ncbi:hypothetical protein DB30_08154 [Enhygromyxa salina]|uniref:Uncharacterized protein n=1 Tax=Enhygromyxa salina TaxID=215803 RepID=A0A0C2CZT9_9BACT|nr:hypothetical protein DB30_08154 [Enhygromyxa salina]